MIIFISQLEQGLLTISAGLVANSFNIYIGVETRGAVAPSAKFTFDLALLCYTVMLHGMSSSYKLRQLQDIIQIFVPP